MLSICALKLLSQSLKKFSLVVNERCFLIRSFFPKQFGREFMLEISSAKRIFMFAMKISDWSLHLIFKKESFIPLLSLMFEHKYNEHKLKKNQILFLNFNKFLFVKNKVDFQKKTKNNCKYNVNRDKISKINFFTKQATLIRKSTALSHPFS